MEHARRTAIQATGKINTKKMDGSHDTKEEQECEICKYDLHLSAVSCECQSDKFSCLLHSSLLCSCPLNKKTALFRYNSEELNLLLGAIELQPGAMDKLAIQEGLLSRASSNLPPCFVYVKESPLTSQSENTSKVEPKRPMDSGIKNFRAGIGDEVRASIEAHGLIVSQNLHRLENQNVRLLPQIAK